MNEAEGFCFFLLFICPQCVAKSSSRCPRSEFFHGFVNHANATLHIDMIRGKNTHHVAETIFKAFGRALRMAVAEDPRMQGMVPSTKGSL